VVYYTYYRPTSKKKSPDVKNSKDCTLAIENWPFKILLISTFGADNIPAKENISGRSIKL